MSKKMNNIDTDDLVFQEEVNEDELYSKKNTSDIIYKEEDNGKSKFLVLLAIILILVSILSAIMGFVFWDKDLKKENGNVAVTKYNLFIIHSNDLYGGSINSFSNYDSLSNAFSYKFVVSNSNPVTLDYSVELVNSNHDKDNVDMTLINYFFKLDCRDIKISAARKYIDLSNIVFANDEELLNIIEIIENIMIMELVSTFSGKYDCSIGKEKLIGKFNIIKNGILK